LNYIISEVNYGGRVTDYKDIKLISALLRKYLCADVMNDSYKLSKLDTYYAPPDGSYGDTMSYID
jgi:dynein heavy chain